MILILKSNILKDVKKSFVNAIGGYYHEREASQIFYLTLRHHFGISQLDFFLNANKKFTESEILIFEKTAIRLCNYEPIQYILGETCFDNCRIFVNEHVLIPRPETEELVDWIKTEIEFTPENIMDIGTGSGCIAISLAKCYSESKVMAIDISEEALQIAGKSAYINKLSISFVKDDIFQTSNQYPNYDLIVSNPPYVEESRKEILSKHVVNNEPDLALFVPSNDPLLYYKAIASFARKHLSKSGFLFVEINEEYGELTSQHFKEQGFNVQMRQDLSGKDRFLRCQPTALL